MSERGGIISSLAAKNYKAYLLFLSLTLILWFAIQMTKTYTYESQLQIKIQEIPKYLAVDSLNQTLKISINTNGLKLWRYNLSQKTFEMPYKEMNKDSFQLNLSTSKVKKFILEQFDVESSQVNIEKSTIHYPYKRKSTKIVPVITNVDLNFSPGYNTHEAIRISPDSVQISGAESELKKISSIQTDKIELNSVNDTVKIDVGLKSPTEKVQLSASEVQIYLPVEKYSENAHMVDISVVNVPDTLKLNIFPNKAKVSFLVALKRFDKISKMDFKIECDYTKRYPDKGIMIPKLEKFPKNIINPKLHIKKVDYLIKQKL